MILKIIRKIGLRHKRDNCKKCLCEGPSYILLRIRGSRAVCENGLHVLLKFIRYGADMILECETEKLGERRWMESGQSRMPEFCIGAI